MELSLAPKRRFKRVLASIHLKKHLFWPEKVKENHYFLATLESARGPDFKTDRNGFHRSQIGRRNKNQSLDKQKINLSAHSIRVQGVFLKGRIFEGHLRSFLGKKT